MNIFRDKKWIKFWMYAGIFCCIMTGLVVGIFWYYQDDLPPTSELRNFTLRTGSEVYDRNGKMIYLFAFEKRKLVSLKELPDYLIDALIVTEDKSFYHHFGIDIFGNIRALFVDVQRMDFSQGASTITQQMARNMFLTLDKQLSRKIKEVILSIRIEQAFTKDEILEIYFNKIFWGGQVHGLETASLYYFGKHARDLNIPESATLIGMIQRPNYYDPVKNPQITLDRRNDVLKKMYKARKITEDEYDSAIGAPLLAGTSMMQRFSNDYFIDYIRVQLERKYGTDRLFEGGLKIYTTLDPDLTVYADSVMNSYLTSIENGRGFKHTYAQTPKDAVDIATNYIQGGLVLMDNKTGQVRALIGGRNFEHSKFNRMTQAKRQPGSSIKPTYYTIAVEKGYTPSTVINDAPITIGDWTPHNFNRGYNGLTRMRTAIQYSYNVWAVKAAMDIGLDSVSEAFRRFGVGSKAMDYSAALGSHEVTPINLISGYTTFPNGGYRVTPVFITKIEDSEGKTLERRSTSRIRVCSSDVAYLMTSMLQSVVSGGTATAARNNYFWDAAGKTGTSEDYRDSWFIGFNPQFTLGIWFGFDKDSSQLSSSGGSPVCTPIWGKIMTHAIRNENKGRLPKSGDPRYTFAVPEGVIKKSINPNTGFTVENGGQDEYFLQDNVPPAVVDTLNMNFPSGQGFQDEMNAKESRSSQSGTNTTKPASSETRPDPSAKKRAIPGTSW